MSTEDLERYETEVELALYRGVPRCCGDCLRMVETERRFYLTNNVDVQVRSTDGGEVFFEVNMTDAWVGMYRQARFREEGSCSYLQGRQYRGSDEGRDSSS